jgi:hypothetical protein
MSTEFSTLPPVESDKLELAHHIEDPVSTRLLQSVQDDLFNKRVYETAFRLTSMSTTSASAFLFHPQVTPPTLNWGIGPAVAYEGSKLMAAGRAFAGLGTTFAANYTIDKAFFNDQPVRGGSIVGDIVAPFALMALAPSLKWKAKVPLMIASHVAGKLADRYL